MDNKVIESFTRENNWSELPREIIELIISKLSIANITRFKSVCQTWHAVVDAYISSPSRTLSAQTPWLMLPSEQERDDSVRFYSLEEERVYNIKNLTEIHDGLCVGSSHGWLVMLDEEANPYLLNPLSRAQIILPPIETFPGIASYTKRGEKDYLMEIGDVSDHEDSFGRTFWSVKELRRHFIMKAILSSEPYRNNSFTVAAIYAYDYHHYNVHIALYNYGDSNWIRLGEPDRRYCDVLFHDDKLYALDTRCEVEIWDIKDSAPAKKTVVKSVRPESVEFFRFGGQYHLAESLGEILFIVRSLFVVRSIYDYFDHKDKTILFKVYKLDFEQKNWVDVESLRERVLFVGGCQSMSLLAKDIPLCESNSIYFVDNGWVVPDPYDLARSLSRGYYKDLGVFNLEDKNVKSCFEGDLERLKYDSERSEPPAMWIVPNP